MKSSSLCLLFKKAHETLNDIWVSKLLAPFVICVFAPNVFTMRSRYSVTVLKTIVRNIKDYIFINI